VSGVQIPPAALGNVSMASMAVTAGVLKAKVSRHYELRLHGATCSDSTEVLRRVIRLRTHPLIPFRGSL
jgi:hypothetical protein